MLIQPPLLFTRIEKNEQKYLEIVNVDTLTFNMACVRSLHTHTPIMYPIIHNGNVRDHHLESCFSFLQCSKKEIKKLISSILDFSTKKFGKLGF